MHFENGDETAVSPAIDWTPPSQRRSNFGCWFVFIATIFLSVALAIIALFLPPFELSQRLTGNASQSLSATNPSIQVDGITVSLNNPEQVDSYPVQISSTNPLEPGTTNNSSALSAIAAIPADVTIQSAIYSIETEATSQQALNLQIQIPPDLTNTQLLDVYGYNPQTQAWQFVAATRNQDHFQTSFTNKIDHIAIFRVSPEPNIIKISYDPTQFLDAEVAAIGSIISPTGLQPNIDGTVIGSLAPGFQLDAEYYVMPMIRNYDDRNAIDIITITSILGSGEVRQQHIDHITLFVQSGGYDGVFIDYLRVSEVDRNNFSIFVRDLGQALHTKNLKLGVTVPTPDFQNEVWETGAYDWRTIGEYVDYFQISMSPDPTWYRETTGLIDPLLQWAIGEVSRQKIIIRLPVQPIQTIDNSFQPIGFQAALSTLGNAQLETIADADYFSPGDQVQVGLDGAVARSGYDDLSHTPYIDYLHPDDTMQSRIWLTTASAIQHRMQFASRYSLAGIGFSDLLADDLASNLLDTITSFRDNSVIDSEDVSTAELALSWRIESNDSVIAQVSSPLDASLDITLEAPDGNYAVNVDIVDEQGEIIGQRNGVEVAMFRPTPTATPTPVPTETPTPAPVVVGAPPDSDAVPNEPSEGGFTTTNQVGAIVTGQFEYGGHVTSAGSGTAINALRQAGMTWMKIQQRYAPGSDVGFVVSAIQAAHQNGFKILVGTVGNPNDLAAGGSAYIDQYTAWLGQIAGAGADAIEVWNEPNISREWPTGQISGASYASMLASAYQRIKSSNGSTLVISGAPAPTGAEAAFPGEVMNDDNFLRQMVEAGGMNYLDCVGAHYNEGIVPPSQVEGDPRDNYYTRYFQTMLNVYVQITGGSKPICFTELGFLSSEGYPPLPQFFSWAENVTVAQQAAWLAEAAALSSQSGQVRLMIVWNVDFTSYGSDPQGGYAMVRPGGNCPACNALANARQ